MQRESEYNEEGSILAGLAMDLRISLVFFGTSRVHGTTIAPRMQGYYCRVEARGIMSRHHSPLFRFETFMIK